MKDFNEILCICINETLGGILGLVARDAIYLNLLSKFSVTREELPTHLDNLLAILEENFGQAATRTISRAIARRLYSEVQVDFIDRPEFNLDSYVREVKSISLKPSKLESRTNNKKQLRDQGK